MTTARRKKFDAKRTDAGRNAAVTENPIVTAAAGQKPSTATLADLADRINAEHQACEQAMNAGLRHALECGRLLLEAKQQVGHGDWLPWVAENCSFSKRTAQAYMRLNRQYPRLAEKAQRVALLTFRGAVAALASNSQTLANAPEDVQAEALEVWEDTGCRNSHQAISQGERAISRRRFEAEMAAKRREGARIPAVPVCESTTDAPDDSGDDLEPEIDDPVLEMLGSFVECVGQLLGQAYELAGDTFLDHPTYSSFEQIADAVDALAWWERCPTMFEASESCDPGVPKVKNPPRFEAWMELQDRIMEWARTHDRKSAVEWLHRLADEIEGTV